MEPLRPNGSDKTCGNPICSNCVQYNGKAISCIPQCAGDTLSDMVYKLGQQMCYNASLVDLTKLDMSCWLTTCPNCQAPTTVIDVLQAMSNYFCTIKTTVNAINAQILKLGGIPPANI